MNNVIKQFLAMLNPQPAPLAAVAIGAVVSFDTVRYINGVDTPISFLGVVVEADAAPDVWGDTWANVEYRDERGQVTRHWLKSDMLVEMEG